MSALLLAVALLAPPKRFPVRPIAASVLIYEDWSQSYHMTGRETNPFLGPHPSNRRLTAACLLAVVANWIPWRGRGWINGVTIGAESFFIIANALEREPNGKRVGIRWRP